MVLGRYLLNAPHCHTTPYTKLPNDDWSNSNGAWVANIDSARFPATTYKNFATNSRGEMTVYFIEVRP